MNTTSTQRVPAIAIIVLGIALTALVATVAGPCTHDDGTVSACATSGNALLDMGVAVAVLALVRLFVPHKGAGLALDAASAVLGLCVMFVPGNVTPLCMMETMHCNAVMHPVAMVCGALIAIVAAISAVRTLRA